MTRLMTARNMLLVALFGGMFASVMFAYEFGGEEGFTKESRKNGATHADPEADWVQSLYGSVKINGEIPLNHGHLAAYLPGTNKLIARAPIDDTGHYHLTGLPAGDVMIVVTTRKMPPETKKSEKRNRSGKSRPVPVQASMTDEGTTLSAATKKSVRTARPSTPKSTETIQMTRLLGALSEKKRKDYLTRIDAYYGTLAAPNLLKVYVAPGESQQDIKLDVSQELKVDAEPQQ